jgi:hypothetical protein
VEHRVAGRRRAGDVAFVNLVGDRRDQVNALDIDILEFL